MVSRVRGKFFVLNVNKRSWGSGQSEFSTEIELGAVYDDPSKHTEDAYYAKATPSGTIKMLVDNPTAAEFFTIGKPVYVDFTEAPK